MAKRRQDRLVDVCLARVGYRRGGMLAFRICQWAYVAADLGHFPSISEYASWTGVPLRTAERHSSTIRHAFSEDEFRSILDQLVAASVDQVSLSAARAFPVTV
jgi:hypothetical protein